MNQHTPGPWTAYNSKGGSIYKNWRVIDSRKILIAKIEELPGGESELANARLIAAAPAMFAALEYVTNWHREHDSGEGELFGLDYVTACINALRSANPDWHTTPRTGHAHD